MLFRKETLFFAFRVILASYLALTISLWMELDSPKWALMTVWIVAEASPGETISKAIWRVMGTVVGVIFAVAIVAAFPQQPVLFDICVALWVGGCCWWGSLIRGSKAYSFVLAGYTCALIAMTSARDPNGVFMMAMARGSYIILGVLCQTFAVRLFAFDMENKARLSLYADLSNTIKESLIVIEDVLKGNYQANFKVQKVFSALSAFQNSVEFRKVEMRHDDSTTDHILATLSSISAVLTRLLNLTVYMRYFQEQEAFQNICQKIQVCLQNIIQALESKTNIQQFLDDLEEVRWDCRQVIVDCIYKDTNKNDRLPEEQHSSFLDKRILFRSLSELLGEMSVVLFEYQQIINNKIKKNFKFTLPPLYNFKMAWGNAIRVFIAVLVACFLWEITAWEGFPGAIGLMSVACGRLCLFENAYKMSIGLFVASILAIIVSAVLNVTLMPLATTIEMVWLALFIPLFCAALAIKSKKVALRGLGLCFAAFFPFMMILGNQERMDEITFFNSALALIIGTGLSVFAFRFIAPYSPEKVRKEIRTRMLRDIQSLPSILPMPRRRRWLATTLDWFISLMRQFNPETEINLIRKYNHGALAVMCIGLNIIEIRIMIKQDILPEDIKNQLRVVMRRITRFKKGQYNRVVLIIKSAIRRLRHREKDEVSLAIRLATSSAISCLILIFIALEKNATFLNPSYDLYNQDQET